MYNYWLDEINEPYHIQNDKISEFLQNRYWSDN